MQKDVQLRLSPERAFDEREIRKALGIGKDDRFAIIRKSVDSRRANISIDLLCRINPEQEPACGIKMIDAVPSKGTAVVVGSGPAGLFAAITLLEYGIKPVVLERGRDVHTRRQDIAKISTMGIVDSSSNYSFGEGGAGTYSDGKLFTRSKKRGDNSEVLGTFVQFGAPENILYEAHPHIGTDKLPKIIEKIRNSIISHGGEVHFETKVTSLVISDGKCTEVIAENTSTGKELRFDGPVILAVGNAARDTFEMLSTSGVAIEAKDIAVGVRLEHPQHLIDCIQYHNSQGRGKFLPAAEYTFATQINKTGVYSFCMCPGGFVVPAASDSDQVVVNGMSPSSRGSVWANSGIVVECPVSGLKNPEDPLSMVKFQQELEYRTYIAAGKTQKAPSQRMTDFINGKTSQTLVKSSYSPGLTSYKMSDLLPQSISQTLKGGLEVFSRQAHGFLTDEAILIGTETRTSSPVRIIRDSETLQSINTENLYPCGEGAGYAGGIVSAAIDGIRCARKIAEKKRRI